ncbi:hypothetical protein VSO49_12275, partial [Myroides odoratimimus]|nr:hypothetical protein [Myroides odoratimimus]
AKNDVFVTNLTENSEFVTKLVENKEFITKLGDNIEFVENITNNSEFIENIINKLEGEYGNVSYDTEKNQFFYINKDGKVEYINWSNLDTVNISFAIDANKENLVITDSQGGTVSLSVDALGETIAKNDVFVTNLTENSEFVTKLVENIDIDKLVKANETVTKLVDNNDGTFTYYNEKEIDQSGAPKPNTGLSFKVPSLDAPVLASFITSGTYTEKSYNYDTMTASSTTGIFKNTNAVQGELFRSTFKTNSNPANTKYLQVMFEVDSRITTIGGYIGNNEVYAKVEFRVLVNNKEVKRFVDKFYRYGGYNFGLNQAYDSYVGMVSLADVPNLSESNTVTITVRPASSTFHKNVGTNDGSIKAGANKAVTYKATGVVIQVFEK